MRFPAPSTPRFVLCSGALLALALAVACGSDDTSASAPATAVSDAGVGDETAARATEPPLDGSITDGAPAGPDADASMDAGNYAPRVPCGVTYCRSDQECVQESCRFPCAGSTVPGDYASVTAALTALTPTGNDVTICLGSTSNEDVVIRDLAAHGKVLHLIGTSPDGAGLREVRVGDGFSDVLLAGFSAKHLIVQAPSATLRGLRVVNVGQQVVELSSMPAKPSTITVDGCDLSTDFSGDIMLDYFGGNDGGPFRVTVMNSYLHGAASYGLFAGAQAPLDLRILNNTFENSAEGIVLEKGSAPSHVDYFNNLLTGLTTGVDIAAGINISHGNNALFSNTNNYAGVATDGPGYVKTDCVLDRTSGVPEPASGSPCASAADATKAPPNDFWNAPRKAPVDIGAVESP